MGGPLSVVESEHSSSKQGSTDIMSVIENISDYRTFRQQGQIYFQNFTDLTELVKDVVTTPPVVTTTLEPSRETELLWFVYYSSFSLLMIVAFWFMIIVLRALMGYEDFPIPPLEVKIEDMEAEASKSEEIKQERRPTLNWGNFQLPATKNNNKELDTKPPSPPMPPVVIVGM